MKKLVKTAKQQFEDRLCELTWIKKYALSDTDLYYLCENDNHEMSILREIHNKEFYEQKYAMSYSELLSSEYFLHEITLRFIEHHDTLVKPLFDWYASADKENEPFTLDDIWMCNLEEEDHSVVYHDLYEEVPDVRIITADEQFESRLKDVGLIQDWVLQGSLGRIGIVDKETKRIHIFVHEDKHDAYTEFVYPPFEELRKDEKFRFECLDEFCIGDNFTFESKLSKWLMVGGDCPLYPVDVYFPANHLRLDETVDFEDKELPQEQSIEKKDFSDRFSSLKSDIIANIGELCENGASIDTEALFESYSIAWIDGAVSYFEDVADFSLMKTLEGHWNYGIEYEHDKGKTYDGRLELLTLESLLHILDSLH